MNMDSVSEAYEALNEAQLKMIELEKLSNELTRDDLLTHVVILAGSLTVDLSLDDGIIRSGITDFVGGAYARCKEIRDEKAEKLREAVNGEAENETLGEDCEANKR